MTVILGVWLGGFQCCAVHTSMRAEWKIVWSSKQGTNLFLERCLQHFRAEEKKSELSGVSLEEEG